MKFSFAWLKHYLDTDLSPQEIGEALVNLGLEVESLNDQGLLLAPFKVGYITETEPHPNADRLQICHVDLGKGNLSKVVCGAPNARPGIWVVYAPLGSLIPSTKQVLKSSEIRGVLSEGMLCSQKELGLADESNGIMELSGHFTAGASFKDVIHFGEILFDLKITPNRPDCFGVFGIARDLSAKQLGTLKTPTVPKIQGSFQSPLSVSLDPEVIARNACPQFMGCYIRGVKNCESPPWLKSFLTAAGLKPISALVDITNYLSLGFSRPLHVFDAHKISDLTVRFAKVSETFEGLNGTTYSLDPSILIISDSYGVQSIAGIMGAMSSGCTLETQDVFLECALFDPILIGKTGQKLMIQSDARQRFERGVDPLSVSFGLQTGLRLILDICGGTPSHILDLSPKAYLPRHASLTYDHFFQKTGVDVSPQESKDTLCRLGFTPTQETSETLTLEIPSWRPDVEKEEDLIEEILRLKGFDSLPNLPLPPFSKALESDTLLTPFQEKQIFLKRLLAQRGLSECVTYALISEEEFSYFEEKKEYLTLENPISHDMSNLRPSLFPGLLKVLLKNENQGFPSASLFELGSLFKGTSPGDQILTLSGIRRGENTAVHWKKEMRPFDLFDIKADVFSLLEGWGMSSTSFQIKREGIPPFFHPHMSGAIYQGSKRLLGFFGALHPALLKNFDLSYQTPTFAFEIFLNALPPPKYSPPKKALFLSPFPKVTRDFAFILKKDTEIHPLIDAIYALHKSLIEDVLVFDVYTGDGLLPSQKSIALRVVLCPHAETLKDAEIKELSQHIIETAQKTVGASLRI
ncbi:MAG: phenylalanine--tRNA ligase subunit beta [Alphaproteobacteria bacterium 16-39-46]|nr:MAG: phenylalanine--tRNA ligase subunit beta [Alphaproteobacteria bacterium 16-39-46]OZA42150.1 MAG: phenylalanine--tRNA ligase subunit beta [Alphaproteobacteria bacterium 17-39-52]HQS84626.1 phenylalanine--tRNA ligase subunit beta [Alphaproteobacteria bacterium]HQS94438.1 phenylalanine--tRNA ligase subunit beta [Alphaproteobacteria bacterium]